MTRAFDRILRDEAGYGQPLIPPNQDFEGGRERSFVVHGLDERFASLLVTTRSDTGTSTPPAIVAINVDLRTGRSVRLDAILDVTRAGFAEALATAIGDAQDGAYLAANRDAIASGEESIWAFAEDKAIVSWRLGGGAPPEEVRDPRYCSGALPQGNSPWRPKSTANSHQPCAAEAATGSFPDMRTWRSVADDLADAVDDCDPARLARELPTQFLRLAGQVLAARKGGRSLLPCLRAALPQPRMLDNGLRRILRINSRLAILALVEEAEDSAGLIGFEGSARAFGDPVAVRIAFR